MQVSGFPQLFREDFTSENLDDRPRLRSFLWLRRLALCLKHVVELLERRADC